MKHDFIQPPLLGVVERLETSRRSEVMDLIVTLNAIGLDAKAHHAQALYDMGMRGVGCYPADEEDPKQVARSQMYIGQLRRLLDLQTPTPHRKEQ